MDDPGRSVAAEGCPLSARELEAVRAIADGLTAQQLAQRTGRASQTVRHQLHAAYRKLGVANAAQAVICCSQRGWLANHAVGQPVAPPLRPRRKVKFARGDRITAAQLLYSRAVIRCQRDPTDENIEERVVLLRIVLRETAGRPLCVDCGAPLGPHPAGRDGHVISRDFGSDAPHHIGSVCDECAGIQAA